MGLRRLNQPPKFPRFPMSQDHEGRTWHDTDRIKTWSYPGKGILKHPVYTMTDTVVQDLQTQIFRFYGENGGNLWGMKANLSSNRARPWILSIAIRQVSPTTRSPSCKKTFRISNEEGLQMAPNASAASCRTILSCFKSERMEFKIGIA